MRQDTSDQYTKVPVLGDVPGLGALFRSKSLSKIKRDLLIFVTPTIVNPDSQTGYEKYIVACQRKKSLPATSGCPETTPNRILPA